MTAAALADIAVKAIASGNETAVRDATQYIRQTDGFLYAMVRDTLADAAKSTNDKQLVELFADVIRARASHIENWHEANNETIAALRSGAVDPDTVKPHIRFPDARYDEFYGRRSAAHAAKVPAHAPPPADVRPLGLGKNINHAFRRTQAVALIETVFGMARLVSQTGIVRWIDIGCGNGEMCNAVNPQRYGKGQWDIVGCDFQEGGIAIANQRKANGRTFFVSDALAVLAEYRERGEAFDIVTMFEFLEHLDDPFGFIKQLNVFRPTFVIAGSPLEQKFRLSRDKEPDPVHVWSFSRAAWERMFSAAGFEPVFCSETRNGTYFGGLDWLTLMCGPREFMKSHRLTLGE